MTTNQIATLFFKKKPNGGGLTIRQTFWLYEAYCKEHGQRVRDIFYSRHKLVCQGEIDGRAWGMIVQRITLPEHRRFNGCGKLFWK